MSRKEIKVVSNPKVEFICEGHKDCDKNAKELKDRPIIFFGKKLNRDQNFIISDMIELKNRNDPKSGVKGWGAASKYMWESIIFEVHNVYENGDCITGFEKDALWESQGMRAEQTEVLTHFYVESNLTEEESKTSD